MADEEPITLKEVQVRLGVPQHVLIHLCEKGVVEPDFAETSGRGNRREFSERNVFEFAVALALRRLELPVAATALLMRVLRSFLQAVEKAVPAFEVPASLAQGLMLGLSLYDGQLLVLTAQGKALRRPLLLAAKLASASGATVSRPRVEKLDAAPEGYETRLDVQLSEIARKVLR